MGSNVTVMGDTGAWQSSIANLIVVVSQAANIKAS